MVLEVRADGTCLAELVLTPQTAGPARDFVHAVLRDGQYEIIRAEGDAFMGQSCWIRHPGGPFTTLIVVATTYLHPEADDLESRHCAGRPLAGKSGCACLRSGVATRRSG